MSLKETLGSTGTCPGSAGAHTWRTVDNYRVERLVGRGGYAEVHEVTHVLGVTGAMKVLRARHAAFPEERARFRWEPRLMNAVRHPGVPRAVAEGETVDGRPYFVMDWIDGETLEARRARMGGRLPVYGVCAVGFCLAMILEAVHAAGVLHLDIKPENLFITRDGHVMLSDFGIARWADVADHGAPCGTPTFMAPEQFIGTGLGPWTDVRALGATLFTLLTGKTACPTACLGYLPALASGKVRPLRSVLPSAPQRLALAIDRALAVDPSARPTLGEIREACSVA